LLLYAGLGLEDRGLGLGFAGLVTSLLEERAKDATYLTL